MTPTETQDKELRKYLHSILKYSETFEEAYDHILTALEKETQTGSFENSVRRVINEEFGSPRGLVDMEQSYYKAAAKDATRQQQQSLIKHFKFPGLLYTLLLFTVIYYSINALNLTIYGLLYILSGIISISWIAILVRYYYAGFYTNNTKKSVKDKISLIIAGRPFSFIYFIFMTGIVSNKTLKVNLLISAYPTFLSVLMVLNILYIVSFLKLNQQEINRYKMKEV